jgi:hypothetical protein
MSRLCDPCAAGPRNIDGHESLFADALSTRLVVFNCAACGTAWSRVYTGSGGFEWRRWDAASDLHTWGGVRVPPKGFGP